MSSVTRLGTRVALLPLSRFDREALRRPLTGEGTTRNGRAPLPVMQSLLARHFAGMAEAPTPAELWQALRASTVGARERGALYNLFGSMRFPEYRELVFDAGLPLYELARALTNAGIAPFTATRWLNRFAAPEPPAARPRRGASELSANRDPRHSGDAP